MSGIRVSLIVACLSWIPLVGSWAQSTSHPVTGDRAACVDGRAAGFECRDVDLLSFLPISEIGGATFVADSIEYPATVNDIWGWTDPDTDREYALVGRSDGTAFVDVSDPVNPVFLGFLPSHDLIARGEDSTSTTGIEGPSDRASQPLDGIGRHMLEVGKTLHDDDKGFGPWRDVKVYRNHALVVADATPEHGIQIFDMKLLRDVTEPPVTFEETAHYGGFGSAHNIAVNEATGFAYGVGSDTCGGALHMVDVSDPLNPAFAGCFADLTTGIRGTGYTHDVQCVVYHGPDDEHVGKEICIGSNETAISIADVTDKARPIALSTASYPQAAYIHQGWLTEDHRYFFQDDELDENRYGIPTRTIIWDLEDLDEPRVAAMYSGTTDAIDHNQYVVGNRLFQSNYKAGLRILDISVPVAPVEVGYFDTYPPANNRGFEGSWSNYPFFASGIVLVSSIREGLFVVQPVEAAAVSPEPEVPPVEFRINGVFPNPFSHVATFHVHVDRAQQLTIAAYDMLGRRVREVFDGVLLVGIHPFLLDGSGLSSGQYVLQVLGESGRQSQVMTLLR